MGTVVSNFAGFRLPPEVITVYRWIQRFTPLLAHELRVEKPVKLRVMATFEELALAI